MHERIKNAFLEVFPRMMSTTGVATKLKCSRKAVWSHISDRRGSLYFPSKPDETFLVKLGRNFQVNPRKFDPTQVFQKYLDRLNQKGPIHAVGSPEKSPATLFVHSGGGGPLIIENTNELLNVSLTSFAKSLFRASSQSLRDTANKRAPAGYFLFAVLINTDALFKLLENKNEEEIMKWAFTDNPCRACL